MQKGRIDYENQIHNTILFSLDREAQPSAYRREAMKLVENLYLYLLSVNEERYRNYGLEITETAHRCIKNYNPNSGDFLNYFNRAIAIEYRRALSQESIQSQHGGMHIPETDKRIILKYLKYAERCGVSDISSTVIDQVVEATTVPRSTVEECISSFYGSFAQPDIKVREDGTEVCLLDFLVDDNQIEEQLLERDKAFEFLIHLDNVFSTRQARQRPILSQLLTLKLAHLLQTDEELLRLAQNMAFFNKTLFKDICSSQEKMTIRDICLKTGVSEQSVSRTYRVFLSQL